MCWVVDTGEQMGMGGGIYVSAQVSKELKITSPVADWWHINYRPGFYCCTGLITATSAHKLVKREFIFYSERFSFDRFYGPSFYKKTEINGVIL
jgi:hypothetical protein